MSEWQPIETAPKDYTSIIGWWRWGDGPDDWSIVICWQSDDDGWDDGGFGPDARPKPTHWMPLPSPPTA